MDVRKVLSKEQFKEFYTFLNIIKPHVEDLAVVQGQFRSRDDSKACFIETQFEYFSDVSFALPDIKALVKTLSTLSKSFDINVSVSDETISFSDEDQTIRHERLNQELSSNGFITDTEMKGVWDQVDKSNPLIKESLSRSAVSNINRMCRDLRAACVTIRNDPIEIARSFILSLGHQAAQSQPASILSSLGMSC
jgi:hypothetical protein